MSESSTSAAGLSSARHASGCCGTYDTRERTLWHLDIWQHETIVHCAVPRAGCPQGRRLHVQDALGGVPELPLHGAL
jgi:hypothetical protein